MEKRRRGGAERKGEGVGGEEVRKGEGDTVRMAEERRGRGV